MSPDRAIRSWRWRSGKEPSRVGGLRKKTASNVSAAASQPTPENPSDIDALHKARLEDLEKPPEEGRKKMRYVGEIVARAPVTRKDVLAVKKATNMRRRHKATTGDSKHSHRNARVTVRTIKDPDEREFVYHQAPEVEAEEDLEPKTEIPEDVADEGDGPAPSKTQSKVSFDNKKEREERRKPQRRQSEPLWRHNFDGKDECTSVRRTSTSRDTARLPLPKGVPSSHPKRKPTKQRTATSAQPRVEVQPPRSNSTPEHARKPSSIFSGLRLPIPVVLEKKTSCLTCGSEDVPISRSAKLACSHRMCHECLRRIFTMSVSDPAHMPPRCCTSKHIPLKHVDKLFDDNFRKTWNRKFQEYTTRNRVYCPARGCGEWIKPSHITVEHGRKVGKCKQCNTRVCCTCNNKMHNSRECPKDPATREFVEIAKQKGWQRCFSCSAMVELKEGCNHMTCRCTAEFCMVCGLKWKSCDCPWFNYENVDAHLGNPARYQEELDRRRDQEQRDEILARRIEVLGLEETDHGFMGMGNAGNHPVDDDFVQEARNILTGGFRQAGLAAERLFNGTGTGRDNPLPGLPLPRTPPMQLHSHRSNEDVPLPAPLPRRHGTFRRQTANPADRHRHAPEEQEGERFAQD